MVGDLYVTSQRLVYLGRECVEYPLDEIRDAVDGRMPSASSSARRAVIEIEVPDPRLLRVEIAAVRVAAREPRSPGPGPRKIAAPGVSSTGARTDRARLSRHGSSR